MAETASWYKNDLNNYLKEERNSELSEMYKNILIKKVRDKTKNELKSFKETIELNKIVSNNNHDDLQQLNDLENWLNEWNGKIFWWNTEYKWQPVFDTESNIEKTWDWEYQLNIDWQKYIINYIWWNYAQIRRWYNGRKSSNIPVYIGNWWIPYSKLEIDMWWWFIYRWTINFEKPKNEFRVSNLLYWWKRIKSELINNWDNSYSLNIDNWFLNLKISYNQISNEILIIDDEWYWFEKVVFRWIARPIWIQSNDIQETRFWNPRIKQYYDIWTNFNIPMWKKQITWTIILPK